MGVAAAAKIPAPRIKLKRQFPRMVSRRGPVNAAASGRAGRWRGRLLKVREQFLNGEVARLPHDTVFSLRFAGNM